MERNGIELETAAETLGDDREVEHRAAAEAVLLVEGELLALTDGLHEVGNLRRGFGEVLDDRARVEFLARRVKHAEHLIRGLLMGCPRTDRTVGKTVGPHGRLSALEERLVLERLVTVENNLGAVGVGERDAVEAAYDFGVLFRALVVDLDGARLVLAKEILHGVKIVLGHIA